MKKMCVSMQVCLSFGIAAMMTCARQASSMLVSSTPDGTSDLKNSQTFNQPMNSVS
jgi:hypothetical protein